jgi:hypothetical protein
MPAVADTGLVKRSIAVLAALALALPCQTAYGWGREGHKLIARIAVAHMNAKALAAAGGLLNEGESIESMSTWADEVRGRRPESATWHYINIPISESREWRKYCPDTDCVVSIIGKLEKRVADASLGREQRREAFLFYLHFLSDLHQPMHAGDLGDRGGNEVQTVYRNYAGNLHSLWDTGLITGYMQTDPGMEKRLTRRASMWESWRTKRGGPTDWVWQSHAVSRDVAYPNLPAARPAQLGEAYGLKAKPCVERQLRRAGLRLASELNRMLGR